MVASRLDLGVSDPVAYTCNCVANDEGGGLVLLFYRYFQNSPQLPGPTPTHDRIAELVEWQEQLTSRLNITGKIRIAEEGFNVTVGGRKGAIQEYMSTCLNHWSFKGLPLSTDDERQAFFKPSRGCACVFQPSTKTNVKTCSEITPLGITDYTPKDWDSVEELLPAEFHRRCYDQGTSLMDLRNHYESRIGYFVSPVNNEIAERPQIRRFSQWPRFVKAQQARNKQSEQLLTYCTGGIRCEKATRWMAERPDEDRKICTLKGGIAAYLTWVEGEVSCGRMRPEESLFKGKNYVFDARGSIGLSDERQDIVAQCHMCGCSEDRLSKCRSPGCHLVLVICSICENKDPRCCENCREMASINNGILTRGNRTVCDCEKNREATLWSTEVPKPARTQDWRQRVKKQEHIDINVKIIS